MRGFSDIITFGILILGIIYVISCIKTLLKIRNGIIKSEQIDKAYCYIILIAILYVLFWLTRIKQ